MNEHQRIDSLIKILEGDNAKAFATKTGIPESSLCRLRKGKGRPASYFDKVLSAYPVVRKRWLYFGTGEPLKEKDEKGAVLLKLESLEKEVKRLSSVIERLVSYQKSTNDE